mmetsp:Transcript_62618/g.123712  ORF Transcript_62618/g.123712 Transcript_62618/m.123712 type:complete len:215 (+) Transcript_62618:261-905(+)
MERPSVTAQKTCGKDPRRAQKRRLSALGVGVFDVVDEQVPLARHRQRRNCVSVSQRAAAANRRCAPGLSPGGKPDGRLHGLTSTSSERGELHDELKLLVAQVKLTIAWGRRIGAEHEAKLRQHVGGKLAGSAELVHAASTRCSLMERGRNTTPSFSNFPLNCVAMRLANWMLGCWHWVLIVHYQATSSNGRDVSEQRGLPSRASVRISNGVRIA